MVQVYGAVIVELGEPQREEAFGFLNEYVSQVLTLGGNVSNRDFAVELGRYEKSKARGGKRTCAICNSAFETREDFSSYSNKKVVSSKSQSGRGICEVCQAEELLRRFALGQTMREEGQTKFLHLYPTYFFTPVTASAMSFAYRQLKNVVFSDIAKELQASDFDIRKLAETDIFKVSEPPNEKRRLERVSYSENEMHAYYLLGVPYLGREPSDTQSWVMPALLALVVPLIFGVKVAASSSAQPTYPTGADFPVPTDMVVIDGAHSFWQHGMKRLSFGLTDLEPAIKSACAMYGLLSEAYKDGSGFAIWNQLGAVARELDSDPLAVFGYADRIESQQSKGKTTVTSTDGMAPYLAERLTDYYGYITDYYQTILGEGGSRMAMIEDLVDKYASFYRARGRAAFGRLRPISLAADVVLDSPTELDRPSLQLQIEGRIFAMLDGVRDRVTEGWIPKGAWTDAERQPFVEEFARYFLVSIFDEYCHSDRAMLRKRLNLLKNGAEAVYIKKYGTKQTDASDTVQAETSEEVVAEGGDK